MGAATNLDGQYTIQSISPGQYDLEVSMIGYKIQLQTGIKVNAGEKLDINFEMEESVLAFGQEVVVIGKKPLLQVDLTASEEHFTASDIKDKMVENVNDKSECRYFCFPLKDTGCFILKTI